nr:MAG TPA: hypothetical protein [Caudoviricetes sp.]
MNATPILAARYPLLSLVSQLLTGFLRRSSYFLRAICRLAISSSS